MEQAAVGFRVKSGRATAVLLVGTATRPKVVDRRIVQLADPAVPDSGQPYHAALDLPEEEGAKVVARLVNTVERFAGRSVSELIEQYRRGGRRIRRAGIVVRSAVDPGTIKNDHIRAHAEEGRLFRIVVEEAVRKSGLKPSVTVEKELFATASKALRIPERRLKNEVTALGREIAGPWRAEEKVATLAAWMMLA